VTTRVELRDAAYRVLASAMLTPKVASDEAMTYAVTLVLNDRRKGRTAQERAVQRAAGAFLLLANWGEMWERGLAAAEILATNKTE
jgi:hypothetical protein